MAICGFYQRGMCKFGDQCKNEHPGSQRDARGFGGANNNRFNAFSGGRDNYRPAQPQISNAFRGGDPRPSRFHLTRETIKLDLTEERPIYPLSCYGPGRDAPRQLIEGPVEISPEELRWQYYGQRASGNEAVAQAQESQMAAKMQQQVKAILDDLNGAIRYVEEGADVHPNRIDIAEGKVPPPSNAPTGSSPAALTPFSKPPAPANPFNSAPQTQASAFGQASNPAFGRPAFGQPANPSQTPSAFGQPSNPSQTTSAFGQPSAPGAFGKPSMPGAFGQTSALGGGAAFGQSGFGKPSMPGAGSGFGQTSALGQTPAFGRGSATPFAQSSPWGQPSAFSKPAFSQAGFGQPSQPGASASPFAQPSQTSQPSPFGQQAQQQPAQASPLGQQAQPAQPANPFGQVQQPQPQAPANPFGGSGQPQPTPFGSKGPAFPSAANTAQSASNPFAAKAQSPAAAPSAFPQTQQPSPFVQQPQPQQPAPSPFTQQAQPTAAPNGGKPIDPKDRFKEGRPEEYEGEQGRILEEIYRRVGQTGRFNDDEDIPIVPPKCEWIVPAI